MKSTFPFLTFLLSIFLLVGCNGKNSEDQLRQRELDLQLRIDSFANVEKEYHELLQMKDSIVKADSLRLVNDSLSSVVKVLATASCRQMERQIGLYRIRL